MIIRCRQCGGTLLYERMPSGEIEVIHSCWSPRQSAIAKSALELYNALNLASQWLHLHNDDSHEITLPEQFAELKAALDGYSEAVAR